MLSLKKRKLIVLISISLFLVLFLALFLVSEIHRPLILFIAKIYLAVVAILSIVFWRCPYCGHSLPIRGIISINNCPSCGEKINDEDTNNELK